MKIAKKLILALLIIIIAVSIPTVIASADDNIAFGAATVNTGILRLRSGPGLDHSVVARLNEGDVVVILERTNSEWYRVNFRGSEGFVSAPLLRDVRTAANFTAMGRITGSRVNIRALPNTDGTILASYSERTVMSVIGINSGWYKVQHGGHTGYIRSDLMEIISAQGAAAASLPARIAVSYPAPPANLPLGQQMVEYALNYVGYNYRWGGMAPTTGFDCSGFVSYIYRTFGFSLTRNASGQFRDNGSHISRSELVPGDLVFFSSNGGRSVTHVGLYIGGSEFVHASSSRVGVVISQLDSAYYLRVWHGAKRVIPPYFSLVSDTSDISEASEEETPDI